MEGNPTSWFPLLEAVSLLATCIEASGEQLLDLWALDQSTYDPGAWH